jgi:hypothetical protein
VSHDRYCRCSGGELAQYQQENSDAPEKCRFPEQRAANAVLGSQRSFADTIYNYIESKLTAE